MKTSETLPAFGSLCRPGRGFGRWLVVTGLALTLVNAAFAQVVLTGTSYTEDFNLISSSGLPNGWSVRTNATAGLGVSALFTPTNSWGDSALEFRGCASLTNNAGVLATNASAATQANFTNRVLAVRQGASFGDPGAAFVFQAENTTGLTNLNVSLDLNMLNVQGRSTEWTVEYAVGDSPTLFTALGSYSDPGEAGVTRLSFPLGADANDQAENLWIRIVALTVSTGSGSRDTFGIDNFELTYNSPFPAPAPVFIQRTGDNVVVRWENPAFQLQSESSVTATFTNVPGATSPHTNPISGGAKYFRLKYP